MILFLYLVGSFLLPVGDLGGDELVPEMEEILEKEEPGELSAEEADGLVEVASIEHGRRQFCFLQVLYGLGAECPN